MKNSNSKIFLFAVLFLVIIVVAAHSTLFNRDTTTREMPAGNKPTVSVVEPQEQINCITSEAVSNCAYLTGFEKRSDGYWYLSFDKVWFNENTVPIEPTNDSHEITTLKAPGDLKVVVDFTEKNTSEDFSSYSSKLIKKDGYYFDPTTREDSFLHNGLYEMMIGNGMVVKLSEGGDFSRPQGT